MRQLGCRLSDFGKYETPEALFTKAIEHGYSNGQLVLFKSFYGLNSYDDEVPENLVNAIAKVLEKTKFKISVLGCYQDLVDKSARNSIIKNFTRYCKIAKKLNAVCVGTESAFALANYDQKQIQYVMALTCLLADIAHEQGVKLGLEFCFYHPYKDVDVLRQLLNSVTFINSLALIFDPANILSDDPMNSQREVLEPWIREYGSLIEVIHAKNFQFEDGKRVKTPLAKGLVDYPLITNLFKQYQVNAQYVLREEPYIDNLEIEKQDLNLMLSL